MPTDTKHESASDTLRERIREHLEAAGHGARAAALAAGLPIDAVRTIAGGTTPTLQRAELICKRLNLTLEIGTEDEPAEEPEGDASSHLRAILTAADKNDRKGTQASAHAAGLPKEAVRTAVRGHPPGLDRADALMRMLGRRMRIGAAHRTETPGTPAETPRPSGAGTPDPDNEAERIMLRLDEIGRTNAIRPTGYRHAMLAWTRLIAGCELCQSHTAELEAHDATTNIVMASLAVDLLELLRHGAAGDAQRYGIDFGRLIGEYERIVLEASGSPRTEPHSKPDGTPSQAIRSEPG